jgi:IS5 family transposase
LLDVAQDRQCAIDSLPLPIMQFHLVPAAPAAATWRSHGADFGKVPTKKQTIFGSKLHLLVTLGGVIRDFMLAPASVSDVVAGADLLRDHPGLAVLGDKSYISAPLARQLQDEYVVLLLTVPRRNQRHQLPTATARLRNSARQIVETVNDQLIEQFGLATHRAHTFCGLCARLYTKLAAHTLCLYLNRLLGNADFLQIKALAFPN